MFYYHKGLTRAARRTVATAITIAGRQGCTAVDTGQVVTSNPTPVRDFIVNDLHRSATMEQAEGAYTHDEKWVLTTVLTRGQAPQSQNG